MLILIAIVLLGITLQDLKSREVFVFWFPALVLLFITTRWFNQESWLVMTESMLTNMAFLLIQFVLITLYFSLKSKVPINIFRHFIGWGDLLLLVSIACYLSVLNYLIFYIISLLLVVILWFGWLIIVKPHNKHIPLAGMQSFLFLMLLIGDSLSKSIDLTNDNWLIHYLSL